MIAYIKNSTNNRYFSTYYGWVEKRLANQYSKLQDLDKDLSRLKETLPDLKFVLIGEVTNN